MSSINNQLQRYNARTSGSLSSKQARLQRFLEDERKKLQSKQNLQAVIRAEQEKVRQRAEARKNEILRRSKVNSRWRVLFAIFQLALVVTIAGVLLNSLRQIVSNL